MLAAPAALYVRTALARRGYGGVRDRLAARPRPVADDVAGAQQTARIAEAVMRRLPAAPTCLVRSLVVWWLVGGDALAVVRLGVAPGETGEAPRFHAWVEVDGVPINDAADVSERYRAFEAAVPPVTGFD